MSRIAIIYFPGTTGVPTVQRALTAVGLAYDRVLWNITTGLEQYDAFVLPAGFSFGDRVRPGVVAAHTPLMQWLKHAAQQGKPILGIGNGCQILIEAGLLPGVSGNALAGATTMNVRKQTQGILGIGLYHSKVYVKHVAPDRRTRFTNGLATSTVLPGRVADSAGSFIFPEELALELEHHQQVLFKYCTAEGEVLNDFPINPNGAMWGIAGLCNPAGNVVGYIPELERDEQGTVLFAGLQRSLAQPVVSNASPLQWQPGTITVKRHHASVESLDLYATSTQTQFAAQHVETILQKKGFQVQVKCRQYWEIWHDVDKPQLAAFTKTVVQSGLLVDQTIAAYTPTWVPIADTVNVLIRDTNDYEGKYVAQQLRQKYGIIGIENVLKGTIWELSFPADIAIEKMNVTGQILQTYVLHNPYAQECMVI